MNVRKEHAKNIYNGGSQRRNEPLFYGNDHLFGLLPLSEYSASMDFAYIVKDSFEEPACL